MKILYIYTKHLFWKLQYCSVACLQFEGTDQSETKGKGSPYCPPINKPIVTYSRSTTSSSCVLMGLLSSSQSWDILFAWERTEELSAKPCYTSTPLMRDPSKMMLKSCSVCRTRMREFTVIRSRRSAFSSYIRVMAGHSANNGIHWGSKWSLGRKWRDWAIEGTSTEALCRFVL